MSKYIHAFEIFVGSDDLTEDATIGLYNDSGDNYIRLSEYPIIGTTHEWTSGIIGIGVETQSADLRLGGAPASCSGYRISIPNTSQLYMAYKSLGVHIIGKSIVKYEFIGTDADSDNTSKTVVSKMIVGDSKFSETEWIIEAKTGTNLKDAALGTLVNNDPDTGNYPYASEKTNGAMVPVTFGALIPEFSSDGNLTKQALARFIRTSDLETKNSYSDDYFSGSGYTETVAFPIYNIVGGTYTVELRSDANFTKTYNSTELENLYVVVVDGTGAGQVRHLSGLGVTSGSEFIEFEVDNYFETDLQHFGEADGSWVQFIVIHRQYDGDVWPCKGFFDYEGNVLDNGAELYTNDNNEFRRVNPYGYDFVGSGSDKNKLLIDPKFFGSDVDEQSSFLIIPVDNVQAETVDDLTNWIDDSDDYDGDSSPETYTDGAHMLKSVSYDGLYSQNRLSPAALTITGESNCTDKDSATYCSLVCNGQTHSSTDSVTAKAIKFTLPSLPKGISFDSCKIMVKMNDYEVKSDNGSCVCNTTVKLVLRKFKYKKITNIVCPPVEIDLIAMSGTAVSEVTIDDSPDFYYTDEPDTGCRYFYELNEESKLISGVNNDVFDTGITDSDEYGSYIEGCLLIWHHIANVAAGGQAVENKTLIYEIAVVLSNTNDISGNVYTPFKGRIFDDTWGSRKTAANLIESPVDILEHIKRLENWGGPEEAGKEYSASALIKTSGDGSYDDSLLDTIKSYSAAFQLFTMSETFISEIERTICREYGLCTYYDTNGYACIKTMENENPSETITYSDLKGSIEVAPPSLTDVYAQPVIYYCYNNATGEYDKSLVVKNVQLSTYDADICSNGFDSISAEEVWNICHALYERFGIINECPASWSNLRTVIDQSTAIALLKKKLEYMTYYRINTAVDYLKGSSYSIFKHVIFNHPFVTNGINRECVIESISKDKNNNIVVLTLAIEDVSMFTIDQYLQDTYDDSNTRYQDTYDNTNDRLQDTY